MNETIYATPETNLHVDENNEMMPFYVVAPFKYWLMMVSTLGGYSLYWFYKNWALYKKYNDQKMIPFLRAIFSIFFCHSLFNKIEEHATENNREHYWNPTMLATIYVIATVAERLIDSLIKQAKLPSGLGSYTWLATPILIYVLYKAQIAANIACGDEDGESNRKITVFNMIWIFIGLLLWTSILAAIMMVTKNMSY